MFKLPVLEDIDREILDRLQTDFPLAERPFAVMAEALDISEEELIIRIAAMKENGLIRRIGGIMDSRNLGFCSTLCAVSVPEEQVEDIAGIINAQPGVTHNYLRDHQYNLWFTLTMPSREETMAVLQELESSLGLNIITMPAEKVYKIKLAFDMGTKND